MSILSEIDKVERGQQDPSLEKARVSIDADEDKITHLLTEQAKLVTDFLIDSGVYHSLQELEQHLKTGGHQPKLSVRGDNSIGKFGATLRWDPKGEQSRVFKYLNVEVVAGRKNKNGHIVEYDLVYLDNWSWGLSLYLHITRPDIEADERLLYISKEDYQSDPNLVNRALAKAFLNYHEHIDAPSDVQDHDRNRGQSWGFPQYG